MHLPPSASLHTTCEVVWGVQVVNHGRGLDIKWATGNTQKYESSGKYLRVVHITRQRSVNIRIACQVTVASLRVSKPTPIPPRWPT